MDEDQPGEQLPRGPQRQGTNLNWRLIRKMEGLVFASLLLAVPFFAFRIMDSAGSALMVRNTSVDLVKDVVRAKDIARNFKMEISVSSAASQGASPFSYTVQNGSRVIEQTYLPRGVSMVGSVTFDESGAPKGPSSFIISKGPRSLSVLIDSKGQTSVISNY